MTTSFDKRPRIPHASPFNILLASVSAMALLVGVAIAETTPPASPPPQLAEGQTLVKNAPDFSPLVERVKPAVVSVQVELDPALRAASDDSDESDQGGDPFEGTPFEHFFRKAPKGGKGSPSGKQPEQMIGALGSGFFISADGYAVTNNHVVDGAAKVQVVTDDGKIYGAQIVGTDPKTDLALIKVAGGDFPFVKLATTSPKIGESVVAIGNPYGLGGTVTAGIVSAQNRDLSDGTYDDYIQIDAPVNRGNSGGPSFNLQGEVVGVNTAIYSPSGGSIGIAFDIPASTVEKIIPALREKGHVERGWLGVQIQPLTADLAESLGLRDAAGALVAGVQNDSPAQKAGLAPGDVITQVDRKPVADARDLTRIVGNMAPGSEAELAVVRTGRQQSIRVALEAAQSERKQKAEIPRKERPASGLGLTVAPASSVPGEGKKGLFVLQIDPAGSAAAAGIQAGDVILKVGEREVRSVKDLRRALQVAKAGGRNKALALVKSDQGARFVALPAAG